MKHEELVEFITNKMSMQHIYQPLLIKTFGDVFVVFSSIQDSEWTHRPLESR
jgi:hypothetical protein